MKEQIWNGYPRKDGRLGIRNCIAVAYLVECAHHVAREICLFFRNDPVHLIGFPGCYPNAYADRIMHCIGRHPNVGAVLLVSLGCESFNRKKLEKSIAESGRPVHTIVIQQSGGTRSSIQSGINWVSDTLQSLAQAPTAPMCISDLVVGTICGGSDATSGITANPACGVAFDLLVSSGGTAIFEETGEMIGLESDLSRRALTPELGKVLRDSIEKAARYYTLMGHGSFAPGNADGGLTTIEEKSLGAYTKSGTAPISGLLKPGDTPLKPGLYLLDVVPDGEPRFGFPNISDNAEIVEMIASGCHLILFTTGRGSVVGSAISPVIKVCANPDTYHALQDDMDINAGRILSEQSDIRDIGAEIFDLIGSVAAGRPTCSEALGHREFILTYKFFEPIGPDCLPI